MAGEICMAGGHAWRGHVWQGGVWQGGVCGRGACMAGRGRGVRAGETVTKVSGTHPIG